MINKIIHLNEEEKKLRESFDKRSKQKDLLLPFLGIILSIMLFTMGVILGVLLWVSFW
jgi:hypothetical protein